jgi:hypothetical protein
MKKYRVFLYVGGFTYKVNAENEDEALDRANKAFDKYLKSRGSNAVGDTEVSEWDEICNPVLADNPVLAEL